MERLGERRIARLCWNTRRWASPSGRPGKTRSANAFEGTHGYGHEEWLFDFENLHEGWQYGFIQGVKHAHRGRTFDLSLYAIHDTTRIRYWVGTIAGVEVLDVDAALAASRRMSRIGMLDRLRKSLEVFKLKGETLHANDGHLVVNVRFRPDRMSILPEPVAFSRLRLPTSRYILQAPPEGLEVLFQPGSGQDRVFKRGINTEVGTRTTFGRTIEVDPVHAKWQARLEKSVPKALPGATVDAEMSIDGHAVDLVIDHGGIRAFVEIKTDASPRRVIRAALSQLMEYAYWPEEMRCDVLLIAGGVPAGPEEECYLAMIRRDFGISVYYVHIVDGRIPGIADLWPRLVAGSVPKRKAAASGVALTRRRGGP
ncbi:hypothetical protein [Luteibacter yeojuensis]|uniref:Uncharacterized protein n=1 Tax=Luteibacter yeojuensis TaxID=345309 RepID=A0A7X5QSF2_9GAMM|nr:hypothetical protein [Luteibacter yeojuensis]NID14504.1 hypothetical protein [Luteibacter yeojuensis]